MQTKILGWGASLATTAILSLAGGAYAQVFSNGDTLNEFGSLQLNNVDFGAFSILFVPEIGGGVLDPAEPGELAREFTAIAGNTGGFSGFNGGAPTPASVRSFNQNIDINGFTSGPGGNTFIELPAAGPIASGALLTLDQSTIQLFGPPGSVGIPIIPQLDPGEFILRGRGLVRDLASGQTEVVTFDFTAQGLTDFDGNGITDIGSFSGTKIVVTNVPEPAGTVGLLALGAIGALGAFKQRKATLK